MSKGYKKEYLDKVKQKFYDVQPSSKLNNGNATKPLNDKGRKVSHTSRMDKLG